MSYRYLFFSWVVDNIKKRYGIDAVSSAMFFFPNWDVPKQLIKYGAKIGGNVVISRDIKIDNAHDEYRNLEIGDSSYIGFGTFFDLTGKIVIEEHVAISPMCTILTHQDVGDRPLARYYKAEKKTTILRKGCWIGAGSIILGGVEVGEQTVVAAGSVVTNDCNSFSVYAGVPARFVKKIE